ncbi:scaffolding protein [Halobacillus litoralis]|uniref:Scaffolding protein n=1 Tax=Halobacillus litoralis TaxID=45668 RepID=A0A845DNB4_9BACI|nr:MULTISPECIES: NifU N-terminal domain-containing protein [Halobacillus]MCA1022526.1 NifU N-terminal domain-containing protein [Halobacillus litoralis]MYL18429.1 scaffolding protein [Halobacillus litoralis]MYL30564.1 scaffolding protein [Halobacillus halophilus]MYL38581.1 scaffolding protein [Halobacillus litoralis]
MAIQVQETPNPNARKFTTESMIFQGDGSVSVMPGQTSDHKIMNELMELDGVDNVFGFQNFITVNKLPQGDWEELTPKVKSKLEEYGY